MKTTLLLAAVALILLAACSSNNQINDHVGGVENWLPAQNAVVPQAEPVVTEVATVAVESVEPSKVIVEEFKATMHTVEIGRRGFSSEQLQIRQGDSVTFLNVRQTDSLPVTGPHPARNGYPGSHPTLCDGGPVEGNLNACEELSTGDSYVFRFDTVGSWEIYDALQLNAHMWVVVE